MSAESSPARIADTERRALALKLRRAGLTYAEIAERKGPDGRPLYATRQAANRAVLRELRSLGAEDREEVRALEVTRLDDLHRRMWHETLPTRPVHCPEPGCDGVLWREPNMHAVGAVLRTMERRARLLGLDARDDNERRVVEILEEHVQQARDAMEHGLREAGVPAETRNLVLAYAAEHLRRVDAEATA